MRRDPVEEFITSLRARLRNPNLYSMEERRLGKEFLERWDAWYSYTQKQRVLFALPFIIIMLVFPLWVYLLFSTMRKSDKLYAQLTSAQDKFNGTITEGKYLARLTT